MYSYQNNIRLILIEAVLIIISLLGLFNSTLNASEDEKRLLQIRSVIITKNEMVTLKDIISNSNTLTEEEKGFEVMETPKNHDKSMSLIALAYKLKPFKQLANSEILGPKVITVKKLSDSKYIDKAKKELISYISETAPWTDWKVDVLFSQSDELMISKVGKFEKMEIYSMDNKSMVGNVAFTLVFFDENHVQIKKININPVILKRIYIAVMNTNVPKGTLLTKSDIKMIPFWAGNEVQNYVTDVKDAIGKEMGRTKKAGDIISAKELLSPICAKKGDLIWVECKSGALNVRLAATAQQTGRSGEIITVKNRSSRKTFRVELTGEKKAEYKLGSYL